MMSKQPPFMKLVDVCSLDKCSNKHGRLPYVGMENIEANTGRFIGDIKPRTMKSSTYVFSPEHVLYGRLRPYLNKVMVPDFSGHCSSEIFPILPNELILRKYLKYWLMMDSTVSKIIETCTGSRMPRADMKKVLDFEIPVPTISEQQIIVNIIEEVLAIITLMNEHVASARLSLDELIASKLQNIFHEKSGDWEKVLFEEAIVKVKATKKIKKEQFKEAGIYPIISQENDFINGYWDEISDLLTIRKPVVGFGDHTKTLKYIDFDFVRGADGLKVLEPREILLPKFFYHQLRSVKLENLGYARHYKLLKEVEIRYPSMELQHQIASMFDELDDKVSIMNKLQSQMLASLIELKQSVLQDSFSGKLTGGITL